MTAVEPPPLAESSKDYGMRLSCCFPGDKRVVHAARSLGWTVGRATACGRWVNDDAIRRDGYPGRAAKPVTCNECLRTLVELAPWQQRLAEIADIDGGWLDGDGERPADSAIKHARRLLEAFTRRQIPGPDPALYPTLAGGVQLEWDRIGRCVELEICPAGDVRLYAYDKTGDAERDGAFWWEQIDQTVAAVASSLEGEL